MEEDIPEFQEPQEDIPESFPDSYDELAQEAELTEPSKRGRGRPKGAKNKEKVPPPPPSESEDEELPRQKKKAPTKKSPESEEEAIPPRQKKTNKPEKKSKPPPPDSDEEEPAPPPQAPVAKRKKTTNKPKPPPSESEEEPPPPPPPPKRKKANFILDVEFDEPSQKKQTPIRMKRPVAAARPLMNLVAEAAHQHGVQERDRRRTFYDSFLPL